MNTLDDFLTLINEELGLTVTPEEAAGPLDEVAEWDSIHLLALLTALERQTGRQVSLPDVLAAATLADIHALVSV